jgi:putative MFS transporter
LLIALNRWIPESARFLIANGRDEEARAILRRYGAVLIEAPSELEVEQAMVDNRWIQLFRGALSKQTLTIAALGLGIGLVLFGFNLWIPSNLRRLGYDGPAADRTLRNCALLGFPFTFVVAWLYGFWSSRKTIILVTTLTTVSLLLFLVAGDSAASNPTLICAVLVGPIWGINMVTAVITAYSSEVFPTRVRGRGIGLGSAFGKLGGLIVISAVAFGLTAPSISNLTLLGAAPMALATFGFIVCGLETRNRQLELITKEEFAW